MKTITWQQFIDIIKSPESLISWDNFLCNVSINEDGSEVSFFFEEDGNESQCEITKWNNPNIPVNDNVLSVFDNLSDDVFSIEIFRKMPWVIR